MKNDFVLVLKNIFFSFFFFEKCLGWAIASDFSSRTVRGSRSLLPRGRNIFKACTTIRESHARTRAAVYLGCSFFPGKRGIYKLGLRRLKIKLACVRACPEASAQTWAKLLAFAFSLERYRSSLWKWANVPGSANFQPVTVRAGFCFLVKGFSEPSTECSYAKIAHMKWNFP